MSGPRASRVALMLTIALSGCVAPPAPQDSGAPPTVTSGPDLPWSMTFEGCQEVFFTTQVPAAGARAAVPPEFRVVGQAQGRASLSVGIALCEGIAYDDGTPVPTALSDVGIAIEAPDGSPGLHIYQVWQVTNASEQVARAERIGVRVERSDELSVDLGSRAPLAAARAEASFNGSTYVLEAQNLAPPAPIQFQVAWWSLSPEGRVASRYVFNGDSSEFRGSLTSDGGEVEALAGGARVEGLGFLPTFGGTGRVGPAQ